MRGLEKQVQEILECIKLGLLSGKAVFADTGLRPPRGILVWGPPGTGKSLLLEGVGRHCRNLGVNVLVRGVNAQVSDRRLRQNRT